MTQRHYEPTGWYVVRLDMAAGNVRLYSQEALGSIPKEQGRPLVNHLLQSMNPNVVLLQCGLSPFTLNPF